MKTIGFVTIGLSGSNGWERYSRALTEAAERSGLRAEVLVREDTRADTVVDRGRVHAVLPPQSYSLGVQWGVFRHVLKTFRACDAIHVFVEQYGPGAALGSIVLRKPFFITIAGTYSVPPSGYHPAQFVKRQLIRFMYWRATCVITGSQHNVRRIREVFPFDNWKFVPFGVDYEHFAHRGPFPAPERPFLLTVGAVKRRKGADLAIEALGMLKDEFPSLEYCVVGDLKSSADFINQLKQIARERGVEQRVHLLGHVSEEELIRLYYQCSVFILPARIDRDTFEGFPMVFYEAHACGAPVISTSGFGSDYVIKDGYNGYRVRSGDAVELAGAIRQIIGNPELREEMSKHARAEAKKHTWDYVMSLYRDIYASAGI